MSVMPLWTSGEAVRATGGSTTAAWSAAGVSIDTRTIMPGDLFVALQGDARDGHEFVRAAVEKGASAALVSRIPQRRCRKTLRCWSSKTHCLHWKRSGAISSGSAARRGLLRGHGQRRQNHDQGEMLRMMLAAPGNASPHPQLTYNNHWGVPLRPCHADCRATRSFRRI